MADQAVPDHGLKSFRMRCHAVCIHFRDYYRHVGHLGSVAGTLAHNAENLCPASLGKLDGFDEIRTYVAREVAAADRKDQDAVVPAQMADFEPRRKNRFPAF